MKQKGNTEKTKYPYITPKTNHKFNYGDKVLVIDGWHINKEGVILQIMYNTKTEVWTYSLGKKTGEIIVSVGEECLELIKE